MVGLLGSQAAGAAPQETMLTLSATPNPAPTGAAITFTANLTGGGSAPKQPTGTISTSLYGNSHCTHSSHLFDLSATVNGNGSYVLGPPETAVPGTYYGSAFFGDTDGFNGSSSTGSCASLLVVSSNPQKTTLAWDVDPSVATKGMPIHFNVDLSGGLAAPDRTQGRRCTRMRPAPSSPSSSRTPRLTGTAPITLRTSSDPWGPTTGRPPSTTPMGSTQTPAPDAIRSWS